jgi:aminopeptidase YwaD
MIQAQTESNILAARGAAYLKVLCVDVPGRTVGSAGNRAAAQFFEQTIAAFGFAPQRQEFACVEWVGGGASLAVGDTTFVVQPSPETLGWAGRAPLAVCTTVEEVEAADLSGKIVLLRGEIAREQVMPKNFPFWNPDEHKRIVAALEADPPLALVTATGRNPELAGAVYPFPLFEDGDFDIPSAYMTEEEGERLAAHEGQEVALTIRAERIPASGWNVVARRQPDAERRIVFFAHIDAKLGTPGALDNAAGVVTLLLLAELLADYTGSLGLELVALNGEDHYSAAGEIEWLRHSAGTFDSILLGVNVDDAGYVGGETAYSLYGCPPALAETITGVLARHPGVVAGEPWYQSDHGLFIAQGVPALALASTEIAEVMSQVAHTPQDTPAVVDVGQLATVARALRDLVATLA